MRVKLKKLIRQESLGKHVRMLLIPQSKSDVQKRSNTYFLLDTCILFWAKVLPQHESTVWLLMSYFGCGSMSQLLSESKSSGMLVVACSSKGILVAHVWHKLCKVPLKSFLLLPWFFSSTRLEAMINSKCAILPSEQRLVYNTTLLEDSVLLADFLPEAPVEVTKLRFCRNTPEQNMKNYKLLVHLPSKWSVTTYYDTVVAFKAF